MIIKEFKIRQPLILTSTVLLATFMVWIVYQANKGFDNAVLDFVRSVPNMDKLLHFALFGSLAYMLSLALAKHQFRFLGRSVFTGVALVFAVCTAEEFAQQAIATRTFDLLDLACDYTGILLAYWLVTKTR